MQSPQRELTLREAFARIGLHPHEGTTFYLSQYVIMAQDGFLKITPVSDPRHPQPEDTYGTESFTYMHEGIQYVLRAEGDQLKVFVQE